MPSTATSSPSSRSISRPARAVAPSSTACARSRPPWATRWSRCPKGCGPRSPSACPTARRTRSRRRCRGWRTRAGSPFRAPATGPHAPAPRHGRHRRRHRRRRRLRGGRARHRSGAGRQQGLEPPGRVARGDGRLAGTRAPPRRCWTRAPRRPSRRKVVVLPSGQGYLVSSTLPSLDKGRTYQLWAIEGNQPISLGLLGGSPGQAAFTMAGLHPTLAPEHHGRAGGRVRLPHRPDHRHRDCLTPARSC